MKKNDDLLLIIDNSTISVEQISLIISMYHYPVISLQLKSNDDNLIISSLCKGMLCYLEYHKSNIDFVFTGIKYVGNKRLFQGVLLGKTLRKWLGINPNQFKFSDDEPLIRIYQRSEKEPWDDFLNRILDLKIYKGTGIDVLCKGINANYGCVWRKRGWSNLFFLNQIIRYYQYITNNIEGWVIHNRSQPISLISRLNMAFDLGKGWSLNPINEPLSNDFSDNFSFIAQRHFQKLDDKNRLKIINELAKRRRRYIKSERNIFPLLPGPVKFDSNKAIFFAKSIQYSFFPNEENEKGIHVSVHINEWDNKPKSNPFQPIHLKTRFVEWVKNNQAKKAKGKLISLKPPGFDINNPGPQEWQFNKGGVPKQNFLYAKMMTPTYVRGGEQGLYCTFKENDELYCLLNPGQVPLCIGAQQKFNPHFDKEYISLNGVQLSFTASPPIVHKKLDDNAVHLKISRNDKIKINADEILAKGKDTSETKFQLDGNEGTILLNVEKACTSIAKDSIIDLREGKVKMSSQKDNAIIEVDGNSQAIIQNANKLTEITTGKSQISMQNESVLTKTRILKLEANSKVEIDSKKVDIITKQLSVDDK